MKITRGTEVRLCSGHRADLMFFHPCGPVTPRQRHMLSKGGGCLWGGGSGIVQAEGHGRVKNVALRTRDCMGCVYLTQAEGVFLEGHDERPWPHQDSCTSNIPSQPARLRCLKLCVRQ